MPKIGGQIFGRVVLYLVAFGVGSLAGIAFAGLEPGAGGGVFIGALVGATGAIVGGWLGAYVLRKADDRRDAVRKAEEVVELRDEVSAALNAIRVEAAGNVSDIATFLQAGAQATTGLQDDNFRLYHELLARHLPVDVFFVLAGNYRLLGTVRSHYQSGKLPEQLSKQDKDELGYVRNAMQRTVMLAQGVLEKDYGATTISRDPRETVKRYLPEAIPGGASASPPQAPIRP